MIEETSSEKKVNVNYGGNSFKQREAPSEREKVDKVITGGVVERKKSLGRKIQESFTGDSVQSVGSYIFFDVIIPAAKDMIFDAIKEGAQRAMYGDSTRRNSSPIRGGIGRPTAYNRMYPSASEPRQISQRARSSHEFAKEIVLESRGEAEKVLDSLGELVEKYGFASVADLYDSVGVTTDFTDQKHGWSDLRNASVSRQREGYLLDLPATQPIDG